VYWGSTNQSAFCRVHFAECVLHLYPFRVADWHCKRSFLKVLYKVKIITGINYVNCSHFDSPIWWKFHWKPLYFLTSCFEWIKSTN
jgi:hypothetical protein